jgi:SAM-dependent methyltransferase
MFESLSWQRVQLSWEEADDADVDADHVLRALGLTAPSRLLDVPCGTGRIAKRLRAMGHDVVGIDATDRFVKVARGSDVPVIRADMRTAVVRQGSFDGAFCLWGSFGYFDEDGNRMHAQAMVDALVPDGRLLVDTLAADTLLPGFVPEAAWSVGDVDVNEVRRYNADTKRVETTWTFEHDDERTTQVTSVRIYTIDELTNLFAACGCASFQAFDDELAPFGGSSDRLWLVATKG